MRRAIRFIGFATVIAVHVSCGNVVRQGKGPVLLVVNSLQGAPTGGFGANQFSGTLFSDVQVLVTSPAPCSPTSPCPTVYSDRGQAILSLAAKNIDLTPTTNNQVTITRYRVQFTRADGRNTPGVDVPYGFDGAVTGTIPPDGTLTLNFELVRHTSKEEAPLVQLIVNPNIIHAIATITFYGRDIVGNDISVTGSMSVDFGNFGDQ